MGSSGKVAQRRGGRALCGKVPASDRKQSCKPIMLRHMSRVMCFCSCTQRRCNTCVNPYSDHCSKCRLLACSLVPAIRCPAACCVLLACPVSPAKLHKPTALTLQQDIPDIIHLVCFRCIAQLLSTLPVGVGQRVKGEHAVMLCTRGSPQRSSLLQECTHSRPAHMEQHLRLPHSYQLSTTHEAS